MDNNSNPFYLKLSSSLITITLLLVLLYVGRSVLTPLFFAAIFCIFLIAPCNFLERHGVHHAIAAIICMLLAIVITATIIYFISAQIISFKEDLPALTKNLNKASDNVQLYMQEHFHVTPGKLNTSLENIRTKALASAPEILGSTFSTLSGILEYAVLIPIYTFLLLLYRRLVVRFIIACFSEVNLEAVAAVLGRTKYVIRSYIFGLLIEMLLVALMTFIGLLIVGSKYALLLAFIVSVLNLIPYLGVLTAAIISIIITASSSEPVVVAGVLIVIVVVHLIDSNILLPKVVGSKVRINALVTIVGVIIGSELWGIPGMFLAVPVMAIMKVLFDGVDELKPWGILLGEDVDYQKKNRLKAIKTRLAQIKKNKK
ncbi:AI-2E family transporter [Arachidicoccus ginsenosidimutans]|uniref:AI-2E family transporter n=1 Tax=Arachidicoccus sp. BS20 TaxID=1850526 RepID=UPI0018D32DD5|nr:AI-2E family transporter [Arachidicoccus sp. BS20]